MPSASNSASPSETASVSASGTTSPSPTATKPSIDPLTLPYCATNQLAWVEGHTGVALGHIGITGTGFKNVSTSTCKLKGYPKLQMFDATVHAIPTHVTDGTSYTVQLTPVTVVVLAPGQDAVFDLGYDDQTGYGMAYCPESTQVDVMPPNTDKPIKVSWNLGPYGGGSIQHLRCGEITVSPVYKAVAQQ